MGVTYLKLTYLKNEQMEWTDFFHAFANSEKLKVVSMIFGWVLSKWAWLFSSQDPKICCISRMG